MACQDGQSFLFFLRATGPDKQQYVAFFDLLLQVFGILLVSDAGQQGTKVARHSTYTAISLRHMTLIILGSSHFASIRLEDCALGSNKNRIKKQRDGLLVLVLIETGCGVNVFVVMFKVKIWHQASSQPLLPVGPDSGQKAYWARNQSVRPGSFMRVT